MVAAQILKLTHSVDDKVTGVEYTIKDVDGKMDAVLSGTPSGLALQGPVLIMRTSARRKGRKRSHANVGKQHRWREMFVIITCAGSSISNVFTGNQLRKSLRKWVSPPDPSINHSISCDIHHGGTAEWFFRCSMFGEWKSSGSLLWIYGKRMFF